MKREIKIIAGLLVVVVVVIAGSVVWSWSLSSRSIRSITLDRTVLPIREPKYPPSTVLDARDATPPPFFEVKAPEEAPNVVIALIDDMGFGNSSAFGGGIPMPFAERLAAEGLRYNEFHTTALCSPTRASLLTGRNSHTNNIGAVVDISTAFPGNTGKRPNSVAPLAEILRLNGYSTAAFGKSHETPPWEVSVSGPFDRWPTGSGFDKFYGFIAAETNQWFPSLFDGTTKIEPHAGPGYHFLTDMADQAIAWTRFQQTMTPDRPFFTYFAPGAVHAPHHVPKEWIAKFKGKFNGGWDAYRQETLERQKKMGIVPPDTELAPKPPGIKDWNSLTADQKRLFSRQMEIYAAYLAFTDHEIGRLEQAITDMGESENTVFIYILGDNGASAEGVENGLFNELTYFNGIPEPIEYQLERIDELGGPNSYNHYASGWAVASDAPFQWTKQVASSYGGTRNGMIIRWPRGISDKGAVRSQWHHVVDIAPTILEAAGLPEPVEVNGTKQTPMEGVSMLYTFRDAAAKNRHTTQYFEILGNRAIYHDGWLAGTVHRTPWQTTEPVTFAEDVWHLYDTTKDFSLAHNLADQYPAKLKELQELFMKEATKYHVLPIDDRGQERFDAALAGRPDLMQGRTSLTLYPGMTAIAENAFISVKNRSSSISAEIQTDGKADGVLLAQGGRFGGWALFLEDGKPVFDYNWVGLEHFTVSSPVAVAAGKATVRYEFTYDGGGVGKGGTGILFVNGNQVAQGRIEKTVPYIFSPDEGSDVGLDRETPVTEAYREHDNSFTGTINKITLEVGPLNLTAKDKELLIAKSITNSMAGCQ